MTGFTATRKKREKWENFFSKVSAQECLLDRNQLIAVFAVARRARTTTRISVEEITKNM